MWDRHVRRAGQFLPRLHPEVSYLECRRAGVQSPVLRALSGPWKEGPDKAESDSRHGAWRN